MQKHKIYCRTKMITCINICFCTQLQKLGVKFAVIPEVTKIRVDCEMHVTAGMPEAGGKRGVPD